MMAVDELRICRKCEIHHFENCPACFGFGVKAGGVPVTAEEAHSGEMLISFRCPICNSTHFGLPASAEARRGVS